MLREPVEGGAEVVVVAVEACGPLSLGVEAMSIRLFRQLREELGMAPAQLVFLVSLPELLQGVLPNRLEDEEAVVADRFDEAVVDQRAEVVELGIADLRGCVKRERAGEDREVREELACVWVEQLVAPFDRRAQRSVGARARRGPPRSGG